MQEELLEQKYLVLAWPGPQDYNEALQCPAQSFLDPELAAGEPETNRLGLPKPTSGMFASVYKMRCADTSWAVRCFLNSKQDQTERYRQIEKALRATSLSCVIPFQFQEKGIRVDNRILPMLKMEWCQGEALNRWLQRNLKNKAVLEEFLEQWRSVAQELLAAGIAHGDLQHGNILVNDGQIKLVDYDCVYVPQFAGKSSNEIGHPNYQHPSRSHRHFGPFLDNFSAWLIYLSVLISGCDPHVWFDFEGGDECLLFRKEDLDDPMQSELFHVLEHHFNPQIREASRTLRYLLTLAPEDVPSLDSAITVPENLPELDAVISDLPDWMITSPKTETVSADNSESVLLQIPQGKKFLKRRRRRGVPLPEAFREGSVNGCWSYEENGLAFNPETGDEEARSSSESQTILSPIVYETTSPVPYRRIGGQLHSPMLEGTAEKYDDAGNANSFYNTKHLGIVVAGAAVLLAVAFFWIGPAVMDHVQWPDDEYYKLADGLRVESKDVDESKKLFREGLNALRGSKDARAPINRARLAFNLGRLTSDSGEYEDAISALGNALRELEKIDGGPVSIEYGETLMELASVYYKQNELAQAELLYKRAITTFEESGLTVSDESMTRALDSMIDILKRENKPGEALQYEVLRHPENFPQEQGTDSSLPKN